MNDAIRFGLKLSLLALAIGLLQLLTYLVAPTRNVPSTVDTFETLLDARTDVLYFGDSTLYRGDLAPNVPERLDALLPDTSVGMIAHDAFHPVLFNEFVQALKTKRERPRLFIVPLHLRALSVERDRRPEYQFVRETYFLRNPSALARAFFAPMASWNLIDLEPVAQSEYLATDVRDAEGHSLGSVADLLPQPGEALTGEVLDDFMALCYDYPLDPTHRQVAALTDLLVAAQGLGVPILVYATPIDVELGAQQMGERFRRIIRDHAEFLGSVVHRHGGRWLDLTDALGRDAFAYDDFPDGYLNTEGKARLAARVAEAARAMLD